MRANVNKHDDLLPVRGILLKRQYDPAIVFDPTGPQSLQLPLKFVCLQGGLERIASQPFDNVKDGFR